MAPAFRKSKGNWVGLFKAEPIHSSHHAIQKNKQPMIINIIKMVYIWRWSDIKIGSQYCKITFLNRNPA